MIGKIQIEPYRPSEEAMKIIVECRRIAEQEHPITVRELYYQLAMEKRIKHTEKECDRVTKIVTRARKAGFIPWEWIEDRSRNPLIVRLYSSPKEYFSRNAERYYLDTWIHQPYYIFIMLEKEALANIVWDVASQFNVPVFPTKGYSSHPLFLEARKLLVSKYSNKKLVVLMLGDFDPSGVDIHRSYQEKLNFCGVYPEIIQKIALAPAQVQQYGLPSLPLKRDEEGKLKDPRGKKFLEKYGDAYTELDALKPSQLRAITEETILSHLDFDAFQKDLAIELREKTKLKELFDNLDLEFD